MDWGDIQSAMMTGVIATFGKTVSYKSGAGAWRSFRAAFDAEHQFIEAGEVGMGFSTTRPVLLIRAADVAEPKRNDLVLVDDVEYRVEDVQPQAKAGALLILKRTQP
jgi:hypothetical protein